MRIRVKSVWNLISGGRREGGTDFVKETLVVKKCITDVTQIV